MDDEKTRQIASLLDKKEEVLSMGCGSGIMELQLENKVVAIDDNKVSIHDATENAKRLELDNKLFVAGHVNDQAAHHLKNHRYKLALRQIQLQSAYLLPRLKQEILSLRYSRLLPHLYISDRQQKPSLLPYNL